MKQTAFGEKMQVLQIVNFKVNVCLQTCSNLVWEFFFFAKSMNTDLKSFKLIELNGSKCKKSDDELRTSCKQSDATSIVENYM